MYGGVDGDRPAVIVKVADADDVARVVALARETGLELAIRSGGHSGAGSQHATDGIVLDLSEHEGDRASTSRAGRCGPGPG